MPGFRTLVVDPEPPSTGLAQVLRDLGHEVCGWAKDVTELASLLAHTTPDLIALDLDLSGGNEGLGLATVLQATGPIPIIFVAEAADDSEREGIRSIDGTALLLKPFGPAELRIAIALAFERTRLAQAAGPSGMADEAGQS